MTYKEIWEKGGFFIMEDNIQDYQIEIRGRVKGSHNLYGIPNTPIENSYQPIARYEVIAGSLEEATDLIREYENGHRQEHGLVKCTMRLA